MENKILKSIINFDDAGEIQDIIVIVDFTSSSITSKSSHRDIRAIMATNKPTNGHLFITPKSVISSDLLDNVASYGFDVSVDYNNTIAILSK